MKVAILIGVADYKNENNLPACSNDIKAINNLIELSGEYEDVLLLDNIRTSSQIKTRLCDFTKKYINQVEQVFFYFTGHGLFKNDEFYFVLPDYSERQLNQSCLQNSELDQLLRNMKADVVVKIVDACNSGFPYIKDPDKIDSYIKSSSQVFKSCYFLFASQKEQSAFINGPLSDFTNSMLEGLVYLRDGNVRFKDVVDIVVDKFEGNQEQKPHYVIQADLYDVFLTMNQEIRDSISKFLENNFSPAQTSNDINALANSSESQLEQRLIEVSKSYCSENDATKAWQVITTSLSEFQLPQGIKSLYEVSFCEVGNSKDLPDTIPVGQWLEQSDEDWFARPKYSQRWVPYEGLMENIYSKWSLWGRNGHYQKHITGYEVTTRTVNTYSKVESKPSYPSLDPYCLFVIPFISQQRLAIVASIVSYKKTDWSVLEIRNPPSWSFSFFNLRDIQIIESHVKEVLDKFANTMSSQVRDCLRSTMANLQIEN